MLRDHQTAKTSQTWLRFVPTSKDAKVGLDKYTSCRIMMHQSLLSGNTPFHGNTTNRRHNKLHLVDVLIGCLIPNLSSSTTRIT